MRFFAVLALIAMTLPAPAQDVALPRQRPEPPAIDSSVALPRERPERLAPADEAAAPQAPAEADEAAEAGEAADGPRPHQAACPAVLTGQVAARALPPISEQGCGEDSPLEVTGLLANGRLVPLSAPAITNCAMASALPGWAAAVDGYLQSRENTRLAGINVGTSYMCRPRNNVAGAETSEHGFANALDVTGFVLEDGRVMALPEGWLDPLAPAGRLLRFAHGAACAQFTTTLGPEANRLHRDHLHLDLGCHGRTCTARLCE